MQLHGEYNTNMNFCWNIYINQKCKWEGWGTALEGEGQQWIAAPAWMASTEQEAKGSLEISALTSAKFLQRQKTKKVLWHDLGIMATMVFNYCLCYVKWYGSFTVTLVWKNQRNTDQNNRCTVDYRLQSRLSMFIAIDNSIVGIRLAQNLSFQ